MQRYRGNSILGILRENHGMWERRSPLSPMQVKELIKQTGNRTKVLVQPCTRRIFSNDEYRQVGATITEDLSPASFIIGVKSPPKDILLPEKAYMFFSHTIKAQSYSMPLLDTILNKKVALFDYECITREGRDDTPRLVAFGAYAGRAGMIDGFQGLGLRLLAEGYSTPFLHVPNTYMHASLGEAREALRKVGQMIHEKGFPDSITPVVVTFTGTGNVAQGAREIFEMLPHQYITPEELPGLQKLVQDGVKPRNVLYGVVCTSKNMVRNNAEGVAFDKQDYYRHPYNYHNVFPQDILPHTTLFVNGIYWDNRFPRLVTKEEIKQLRSTGNHKLKAVADISCDIGGSCEFLHRPTSIEKPFYSYNPETGEEESKVTGNGILMLGVDNLPSELPRDASQHFGDGLLPLLPPLLSWQGSSKVEDMTSLSPEMYRACVAAHGSLMPKWQYIQRLREQQETSNVAPISATLNALKSSATTSAAAQSKASASQAAEFGFGQAASASITVELVGHLFDTGLINTVMDTLELHTSHPATPTGTTPSKSAEDASKLSFNILVCDVRPNNAQGAQHSRVVIQISGQEPGHVQRVAEEVCHMVTSHKAAEGTATIIPLDPNQKPSGSVSDEELKDQLAQVTMPKRILLFGAGRVALPVAKYFRDQYNTHLTVATEDEEQAKQLIDTISQTATNKIETADGGFVHTPVSRGRFVPYRFPRDNSAQPGHQTSKLAELVHNADVVVSLLPATMHLPIAEECLRQGKDMVTASYVSPAMQQLHEQAKAKNVIFLNEVGLDPGMDHMMIMSAIDHVRHSLKAEITELVSLCGGLPDPITASMNPLKYKISWSPRGVLTAALNPARYLQDNQLVEIPGSELLRNASNSQRFPTLRLEVVPNRDSLIYRKLYGLEDSKSLQSLCRGTLRYEGWANAMHALQQLGLLSLTEVTGEVSAWTVVQQTLSQAGFEQSMDGVAQFLASQANPVQDLDAAVEAVCWLGLVPNNSAVNTNSSSLATNNNSYENEEQENVSVAKQSAGRTPLDALSRLWERRLPYDMSATSNEKDMVAMYHQIAGRLEDGRTVRHQSRLLAFGTVGGDSAMAATVGFTTAAAIDLLLKEKHASLQDMRGVVVPTDKRVYQFILEQIQKWGITWSESITFESPNNKKK